MANTHQRVVYWVKYYWTLDHFLWANTYICARLWSILTQCFLPLLKSSNFGRSVRFLPLLPDRPMPSQMDVESTRLANERVILEQRSWNRAWWQCLYTRLSTMHMAIVELLRWDSFKLDKVKYLRFYISKVFQVNQCRATLKHTSTLHSTNVLMYYICHYSCHRMNEGVNRNFLTHFVWISDAFN